MIVKKQNSRLSILKATGMLQLSQVGCVVSIILKMRENEVILF